MAVAACCCTKKEFGNAQIRLLFAGFAYVGAVAAPYRSRAPIKRGTLPSRVTPGLIYVFHLQQDFDPEALVCRTIPDRLRSLGAEVLYAPRSGLDMATPNLGNPVWGIDFKFGKGRYALRNAYDPVLDEEFARRYSPRRRGPDPRTDRYLLSTTPQS